MTVTCLDLAKRLFGRCERISPSGFFYFPNTGVIFNAATEEMAVGKTTIYFNDFVHGLTIRRKNGGGNGDALVAQHIAEMRAKESDPTDDRPELPATDPVEDLPTEGAPQPELLDPTANPDPIRIVSSDSQLPEIELTKFTKYGGPLTKRISLAPDDTLVKDGSACVMTQGIAERVKITGIDALATLIKDMTPSQAFTPGVLRPELPNRVGVTTKDKLFVNGVAKPNLIARTGADIIYCKGQPAVALVDYDTKGMPSSVTAELQRRGGFWPALETVLLALKDTARVTRCSTSSGLSNADTGAALPGTDGIHVYVAVKDGADSERFLRALHDRCWLAGLGWYVVSSSGALLDRSIVDRMVGGPEHLMFEGGPVLAPPLVQDKKRRQPIAVDGEILDTEAACPPLSIVDHSRLVELKAKERVRLAPEMARARAAFVAAQAEKLIARTHMTEDAARLVIVRQCEGVLRPDVVLSFDEEALGNVTVGDVLANPELYQGQTLADPLEGVAYGRCVAKIMRRADGTPWIHSFAHGRTVYELKHDAANVRKAMEKAEKDKVVAIFTRLAAGADLDPAELAELRQLAKKLSGINLPMIDAALKAAQQKKAKQNAESILGRRQDPRPAIRSPRSDEPFGPQMDVLNEVIGSVIAAKPPSRDIDDEATRVRKLPVPNTHAFSQSEVNVEPEEPKDD
jgi:hypothetical protein